MFVLICLTLVAFCSAIPDHSKYSGHQVHRALPRNEKQLNILRSLGDNDAIQAEFWTEPRAVGIPVDIQISEDYNDLVTNILKRNDIRYKTIIEDVESAISNHLHSIRKRSERPSSQIWDDYLEYDEMMAWIDTRAADCGSRCEISSIGNSYEGNDQKLIKITNGDGQEKEGFWIDCGIHAREWISPAVCTYFIDRLIADYTNDSDVTEMLDNYDYYILSVMNPDGYIYTHTDDRLWRKSRRPNSDVGSPCYGTDINRNFDHEWGTVGVSYEPCSNTYCGPAPYSEIEAGNVAAYVTNSSTIWRVFYTMHSYSQLWMAPWGYTTDPPQNYDELMRAANIGADALTAVYGTPYTVGSASEILYSSSGTSRDWAYGVPAIEYVYTIELRDEGEYGFLLPPEQIEPTVIETWAGIKAFTLATRD